MKKLIMLSVFALGTITASAETNVSNTNRKLDIAEFLKPNKIQNPFAFRYLHRVWAFKFNTDLSTDICYDRTFCLTDAEMEMEWWVINEQLLSCPGYHVNYTKGGICF